MTNRFGWTSYTPFITFSDEEGAGVAGVTGRGGGWFCSSSGPERDALKDDVSLLHIALLQRVCLDGK